MRWLCLHQLSATGGRSGHARGHVHASTGDARCLLRWQADVTCRHGYVPARRAEGPPGKARWARAQGAARCQRQGEGGV